MLIVAKNENPNNVVAVIRAITNAVSSSACAYIICTPNPPSSLPLPIINSPTIAPITLSPALIFSPENIAGRAAGTRNLKKLTILFLPVSYTHLTLPTILRV